MHGQKNVKLCGRSTRGSLQGTAFAMTDRVKQINSQDSECHDLDVNPALAGHKSEEFPLELMCLMGGDLNSLPKQFPLGHQSKVKVKSTLEQFTKAHRRRCIPLLFVQPRR